MAAAVDPGVLQQALDGWSQHHDGPLYRRLAAALEAAIEAGTLVPGTRLPAERDLAATLSIARNTVGSALEQLASDGRIRRRRGAGTFVSERPLPADRGRHDLVSGLDDHALLHDLSGAPRAPIEFVAAAVSCAPEVRDALREVDADRLAHWTRGHGYLPLGLPALRRAVAMHLTDRGLPTEPRQVMVTAGAVEGVLLAARLFLEPGDPVAVEAPSYIGALDVLRSLDARLVGIPVDRQGVRTDELAAVFTRSRPRLAYLVPDFHNPTGAVTSLQRRHEVARLSAEFHVPVIEDLVQHQLWFEQPPPVPIASLEPAAPILTLGSMSKVFWGGLRIGWIRAEATTIQRLGRLKTATNYSTAILDQYVATALLDLVEPVAARRREELAVRRDRLDAALRRHLPDWHWALPPGGLSLWALLPDPVAPRLARRAERHGVAVAAGHTFGVTPHSHDDRIRLPFVLPPATLEQGVRQLAAAWRELQHEGPAPRLASRLVL